MNRSLWRRLNIWIHCFFARRNLRGTPHLFVTSSCVFRDVFFRTPSKIYVTTSLILQLCTFEQGIGCLVTNGPNVTKITNHHANDCSGVLSYLSKSNSTCSGCHDLSRVALAPSTVVQPRLRVEATHLQNVPGDAAAYRNLT